MHIGIGVLAALLVIKFLATMISYASGAPGGIFAPMLLIGALMGTIAARIATGIAAGIATRISAIGLGRKP